MSKQAFKITAEAKNNKAVIRIDGNISYWNNHAMWFKSKLDEIIAQGISDADIYINSGGGYCFEANEIANEILRFPGTITAHLGALCASAATYIAVKCTRVVAAKNCSFMIHKPMTQVSGNADQIEADLKLLKNLQKSYLDAYVAKTGLSPKKIEEMWVQDYWMDVEEAKNLKFIDEIEGEVEITEEDVEAMKAYKGAPVITATAIQNPDTNNQIIMKNQLITVLALVASATEAQIVAEIEVLKNKAARADVAEQKLADLKKEADKAKIDAVLEKNAKKYLPASEGFWRKQLEANFEETKQVLDQMPLPAKLSDFTQGTGANASGEDRSKWTYADYQEKDSAELKKMADNDPDKFNALAKAHYGEDF